MTNRIKTILVVLIAALALLVFGSKLLQPAKNAHSGAGTVNSTTVDRSATTVDRFEGTPARFDGYYKNQVGQLIYLIRFFPEGRVVSVNGTSEVEKDLHKYLIRETKGNPAMGLHNVAVEVVGDSIFYMTRPEKGEIEYRGRFENDGTVRLFRHSHITGTKQIMEYTFVQDGTSE